MKRASQAGQSAIEAIVVVPLCVLCAVSIVDAGVVIRDQIAATRAAGAAARAEIDGSDALSAARAQLPEALRSDAEVRHTGDGTVEVSVEPRLAILDVAGELTLTASAAHDTVEGSV
jgi:hypothetical protein